MIDPAGDLRNQELFTADRHRASAVRGDSLELVIGGGSNWNAGQRFSRDSKIRHRERSEAISLRSA